MLARLGSLFLALTLMVNIVIGCATMTNSPSASVSKSADNTEMVQSVMAGCDMALEKTKGHDKQHGDASSFCKSFCANMIAEIVPAQTSSHVHNMPNQQLVAGVGSWDSSVDPPHPRPFMIEA
jgi:hypothetical protein